MSEHDKLRRKRNRPPTRPKVIYGRCAECGWHGSLEVAQKVKRCRGCESLDLVFPSLRSAADKLRERYERFQQFVEPVPEAGCHLWTGLEGGAGYGHFRMGGQNGAMVGAHRIAYEIERGPIPDGLFVCHKCDTPLCVNPAHLFLGTHADNMADMRAKGRHAGPFKRKEQSQ